MSSGSIILQNMECTKLHYTATTITVSTAAQRSAMDATSGRISRDVHFPYQQVDQTGWRVKPILLYKKTNKTPPVPLFFFLKKKQVDQTADWRAMAHHGTEKVDTDH
jgi:hypothetical protein